MERPVIELELVGVRVELPANQPIILLKEVNGTRYLPIWIGATEAAAIAFALQGVETPRPLTHDLFVDVLGSLDVDLVAVHITDLQDGTYYAELQLTQNGTVHAVSARPSDAIALASRMEDVAILGEAAVLDDAGIEIAEEDPDGDQDPEEEVQRFRDFLDSVTPEDFKNA